MTGIDAAAAFTAALALAVVAVLLLALVLLIRDHVVPWLASWLLPLLSRWAERTELDDTERTDSGGHVNVGERLAPFIHATTTLRPADDGGEES